MCVSGLSVVLQFFCRQQAPKHHMMAVFIPHVIAKMRKTKNSVCLCVNNGSNGVRFQVGSRQSGRFIGYQSGSRFGLHLSLGQRQGLGGGGVRQMCPQREQRVKVNFQGQGVPRSSVDICLCS